MIEDIKQGVRSTVCAVIERDNKVLLVKRNHEPFKDYWCLPGGHIDFGETAQQAVIREVKEETGLTFTPKFLNYRDELYPDINWHGEVLLFHGKAEGKEDIDGLRLQPPRLKPPHNSYERRLADESAFSKASLLPLRYPAFR